MLYCCIIWKEKVRPLVFVSDCRQPMQSVFLEEGAFLVIFYKGSYTLLENRCAHLDVPLSEGWFEDGHVVCPWHQWKYNLSGECVFPLPACSERIHAQSLLLREDILWLEDKTETSTIEWNSCKVDRSHVDITLPTPGSVMWRRVGLNESTRIWCGASCREEAQQRLAELCEDQSLLL